MIYMGCIMAVETGERIYSNQYFDLLLPYNGDPSVFDIFPNSTYKLLSANYAVVYVPKEQITNNIIAQLGYLVIPTLSGLINQRSLEASGITRTRGIPTLNLRGNGVLIGIVDTGIDYTNPVFLNADHSTRIAALWDQTIIDENYASNTYYGMEFTREQINKALQSPNPYEIVPSRDEIGHGTMIAGIAAGNEVSERNFAGVAPDSELIIVKLKPAKNIIKDFWRISENVVCFQENDIQFALMYFEATANKLGRPLSICLALGSSLTSHDDTSRMNTGLSGFSETFNFVITTAAGNEGNARRHYFGKIDPIIGYNKVELSVSEQEGNFSMELWGDAPGLFAIDIKSPSGEYIPKILPRKNENYEVSFIFEKTNILIDYQVVEAQSGDQLILFRFTDPAPGIWSFNVYGKGDISQSFHVWLPMEGFISDDTYFISSDPYTTTLSLGNADGPITATAYNAADDSLYLNAGRGYTRSMNIKPTIAAPGVDILSPSLEQSFRLVTGTSAAAAHTAGVAALLLEWGIVKGNMPKMNTINVKFLMIHGARRDLKTTYPNREWGYGILDVFNIFDSLRQST